MLSLDALIIIGCALVINLLIAGLVYSEYRLFKKTDNPDNVVYLTDIRNRYTKRRRRFHKNGKKRGIETEL